MAGRAHSRWSNGVPAFHNEAARRRYRSRCRSVRLRPWFGAAHNGPGEKRGCDCL